MNAITTTFFPIDGTAEEQAQYIRLNGSEELAELYSLSTPEERLARKKRAEVLRQRIADQKLHFETVLRDVG